MKKGYWVAHIEVHNDDAYKKYVEANAEPFKKFGARFLVRGGQFETPEGNSRSRNVVLEFESYQQALDCYHSPEYAAAKALREGASEGDLMIIEGYEG